MSIEKRNTTVSEDEEEMSAEEKEIRELIESAEWDMKAEDFGEARKKLDKAKQLAKKLRNEDLLKKILTLLGEPDIRSKIAEYQLLNNQISKRGQNNLTIFSVMTTVTLTAVFFAFQLKDSLGGFAGYIPVLSFWLILNFYIEFYTSKRVNDICFKRVHVLEDELRIKGNQYVHDILKNDPTENRWYWVRTKIRHVVSFSLMIIYVAAAIYLFIS